jgi:hypothetical protein
MRLVRADGSIAASSTVPAAVAPDRDWLALDLAPEPDSADRSYVLELRARGTGPRNALAFGAAPPAGGADAGYVLDGVAADAALTLRTFAADGSAAEHHARRA